MALVSSSGTPFDKKLVKNNSGAALGVTESENFDNLEASKSTSTSKRTSGVTERNGIVNQATDPAGIQKADSTKPFAKKPESNIVYGAGVNDNLNARDYSGSVDNDITKEKRKILKTTGAGTDRSKKFDILSRPDDNRVSGRTKSRKEGRLSRFVKPKTGLQDSRSSTNPREKSSSLTWNFGGTPQTQQYEVIGKLPEEAKPWLYPEDGIHEDMFIMEIDPSLEVNYPGYGYLSSPANQFILPLMSGGYYDMIVDWGDGTTDYITEWDDPACQHYFPNGDDRIIKISGDFRGLTFAHQTIEDQTVSNYENGYTAETAKIRGIKRFGTKFRFDVHPHRNMYPRRVFWAPYEGGFTNFFQMSGPGDVVNGTGYPGFYLPTYSEHAFEIVGHKHTDKTFLSYKLDSILKRAYPPGDVIVLSGVNPYGEMVDWRQEKDIFKNWNIAGDEIVDIPIEFPSLTYGPNGNISVTGYYIGDILNKYPDKISTSPDIQGYTYSNKLVDGKQDVSDLKIGFEWIRNRVRLDRLYGYSKWDTTNVKNLYSFLQMEGGSNPAYYLHPNDFEFEDLGNWNVSNVTNMRDAFRNCTFGSGINRGKNDYGIGKWDVSNVKEFYNTFATACVPDSISNWNTPSATGFNSTFAGASGTVDLSNWDVSNVTYMANCFQGDGFIGKTLFYPSGIENWDVSNVERFDYMFSNCSGMNIDVSKWNMSSATNISNMFASSFFNGDVSNWNVSNVWNMYGLFQRTLFNGDISKWDVSKLTYMSDMFAYSPFNQDISNWSLSSAVSLAGMFRRSQFNQDISNWDVSSVTGINYMFYESSFNQDISSWNVSNVGNFDSTFYGSSFDQDISSWDFTGLAYNSAMRYFVRLSSMSATNLALLLQSWVQQAPNMIAGVRVDLNGLTRNTDANNAINTLVGTYGWTITY